MARYQMQYVEADEGYQFIMKNNNFEYLSTIAKNKNNKIKRNINPSLNKYDVYDTILDAVLKSFKLAINDSELEQEAKNLNYNRTIDYIAHSYERYKDVLNVLVDFNYLTLDMAIKLADNGFTDLLPKKFKVQDFDRVEFDEAKVKTLNEKYNKVVLKDQLKYIQEEKRSLECEQKRVSELLNNKLNEMASITKYKNDLEECLRKIK